jgi:hypothetical protein
MEIDFRGRIVRALCLLAAPLALAGPAIGKPVDLGDATATYCQGGFPISDAVDGSLNGGQGWAIDGQEGNNQVAVFKTDRPIGGGQGTSLTFRFHMLWGDNHTLGRFRLAVTTSDPSTFGQGSTCGDADPAGSAAWTVLQPSSLASENGQTLTVQPDGSILASGDNPLWDVVTFKAATSLTGITGVRLEALADASFKNGGPGRATENGNFVLTELVLDARSLHAVPTLDEWAMALMALLLAGAGMLWLRRQRS